MRLQIPSFLTLTTALAISSIGLRPLDASATPARSKSLSLSPALEDDTDVFFFPASIFLFENAAYADLGTSSFSGSGGLLFHRHHGVAGFIHRDHVGRTQVGFDDDLAQTMLTLPQTVQADATGRQIRATPLPLPEKILDLMFAKPLSGAGRWLGLGVSVSHKSEDRGTTPTTLTDETGLPITATYSQKARSTLLAFMPGYTRTSESDRLEMSANVTLSLFRVRNSLAQDIPLEVDVIPLAKSLGTVRNQAGPPSVGGVLRWQTLRNDGRPDWVLFTSLDRRDFDSVSPIEESRIEADRYQFSMQAGPRLHPVEVVTLSLMGEFGFDQLAVAPSPGPSTRRTTITLPGIHAAAEARVSKYLSLRGAITSGFEWQRSRLPVGGTSDSARRTLSDTDTSFAWAVGVSGHFKSLDIDASVQPTLLTQGPYILGGPSPYSQQGIGTGLFSLLSLTYRFGAPAELSGASESNADAAPGDQP